MAAIRVLLVQATGEIGGAEVALLSFLRTASRADVEALVAVLRPGPLTARLTEIGVSWRVFDAGPHYRDARRTLAGLWWLTRLARSWGAQVIHSNGTRSHLYGGPAALSAGRPYLWRLCDMLLPGTSRLYTLAAWIPAGLVITDSDAVATQAQRFSRRFARMRTIYPGTGTHVRASGGRTVRAELGIPLQSPVVAVIGRLQRWKGQADVIRAAPAVLDRAPDTHFLVVGGTLFGLDAEYPAELARLTEELGVAGRVLFTGQRDDVPDILDAVDVVVVPSRLPEPFGTIQIEAMAAGKPLVSTAAGGNPEVVEDGHTGLLVAPGAPSEIATAVCRLLEDPALRTRMGRAGQERVRSRFTVERMTAEIVDAYHSVLRERGLAAS